MNADALLGFAGAAKRMGMDDRAAKAMEKGKKQCPLDRRSSDNRDFQTRPRTNALMVPNGFAVGNDGRMVYLPTAAGTMKVSA